MLKILLGDMNAQKKRITDMSAKALKAKNRQLLIVVPAQATFLLNRQIIEECHVPGYMHVRPITFEKLTQELLLREGGRAKKSISTEGLSLMCADAIKRTGVDFDVKKDSEIHIKSAAFIRTLMQEGITWERTEELAEKLGGTLGLKLKAIAKIYENVSERLENNPSQADLELIAKENAEKSEYIKNSDIAIYRFDVFPKRRLEFIYSMAKVTNLSILIDGDEEHQIVKRIYAMNAENGLDIPVVIEKLDSDASNSETSMLANNLFNGAKSVTEKAPEHIELYHCKTKQEEVENACVKILEYSKTHKMSEIALVMQNVADYEYLIKDLMRENEIPYFISSKRSLSESKLTDFLLTAIDSARYCRIEDIVRYIKSGFLNIDRTETENLIRLIYEYGMKPHGLFREFERAELKEFEDIRKRALSELSDLTVQLKTAETPPEFCKVIRDFIESLNLTEKVDERCKNFLEFGLAEESAYEAQVIEKILAVLDQIELFIGNRLDADEFAEIFSAGISSADISTVPPMNDQVAVGSITHGIYGDTGLVIILGVNDSVLPSADTDGNQFLLSSETELLKTEEEFFPMLMGIDEQKRYIKRMIAGSKELILSYNDETGTPSYMIAQTYSIYPGLKAKDAELPVSINGGLRILAKEIRQAKASNTKLSLLPAYIKDAEGKKKLSELIGQLYRTNGESKLSPEMAKMLYGSMNGNASTIQEYYRCPFRYFVGYGLKPFEMSPYEEDPASTGNYAHDTLNLLTRDIKSSKQSWAEMSDIKLDEFIEKAAKKALDGHNRGILEDTARGRFLRDRLIDEVKASARAIRTHFKNTNVRIEGSELSFGYDDNFRVRTPFGDMYLTGKIDRLDIADAGGEKVFRIVDYKTREKSFSFSEFFYGTDIQLLVYVLAVLNVAKYKNLIPAGAFYFHVDYPFVDVENANKETMEKFKMSGIVLNEEEVINEIDNGYKHNITMRVGSEAKLTRDELRAVLKYLKRLLKDAMNGIAGGNIEIKPIQTRTINGCRHCPYISVCKADDGNCMIELKKDKTKQDVLEEMGL